MERRAHVRKNPVTGQPVQVAAHHVRGGHAQGSATATPTGEQTRRVAAAAAAAADAPANTFESEQFYASSDFLDGPDDISGTADDFDGYLESPGESTVVAEPIGADDSFEDEPFDDGFSEIEPFALDDLIGGGGGGGGGGSRGGAASYAARQSLLRRGRPRTGGGAASGFGFNPSASIIGRLLEKYDS